MAESKGKLQRGPILPAGRYWQDFFGQKKPQALAWFKVQIQNGRAKIIVQEGDPTPNIPVADDGLWILWEVPTGKTMPWPELEFGAPTIAVSSVKTREDTVDAPPPEHQPTLEEAFSSTATKFGMTLGFIAFGAVAVNAIINSILNPRR